MKIAGSFVWCALLAFTLQLSLVNECSAAKILVIAFISGKSHELTYMPLIEELGKRGHEVTYLAPVKSNRVMKNVKESLTIDQEAWMEQMEKEQTFDLFRIKEKNEDLNPFLMIHLFEDTCRKSYDLPQVQALLKEQFDLVLYQPLFNDCLAGLIHKLKAPTVLFSCVSVPSFIAGMMGNHFPSSITPHLMLDLPEEMNFFQRFTNFGYSLLTEGILRFYFEPAMTKIYREKLGDNDLPSSREVFGNASLLLSNGHFSLHRPKPYFPDIIDVGGIHAIGEVSPLPKELEDFIKKGKEHGFIYFSMGTQLKGSRMPEERRKRFLRVFSKLKQQVIWKWETESMPDQPPNVLLRKWLPQQDILAHKEIKIFITHCGGGSTEETIHHGVPVLGFPMFGDQPLNAKLAKAHDFIVELDWNTATEEQILGGINELLNNPKYRNNVKRLSALYRDQPDSPLQRAVWWVEYVIRHQGAPQLRSVARKLNFMQYHSYDVIIAYFALILGVFYLAFAMLRWVVRLICFRSQKTSGKKSKRE